MKQALILITLLATGCADNVGTMKAAVVPESPAAVRSPRVTVLVAGPHAENVELRRIVGWEVLEYNVSGPSGGSGPTLRGASGGSGATGAYTLPVSVRVCAPPCDVAVDGAAGKVFYFGGEGLSDSAPFTLARETAPHIVFTVSPGRKVVGQLGVAFAGFGGIAAVASGAVLSLAAASQRPVGVGAPVVFGAGAGLLGVGLVMVAFGRTTYAAQRLGAF